MLFPGGHKVNKNRNSKAHGNRKLQLRDATSVELSGDLKDMEDRTISLESGQSLLQDAFLKSEGVML